MKQFILFITIIFSTLSVFAQDKDIATESYNVDGTCGMCKKRIEKAAYIKGVKRADWDKDTHKLTLVYRPSKTSANEILTAVAKAGHSNEMVKATAEDYENLPKCCHYETETCEH